MGHWHDGLQQDHRVRTIARRCGQDTWLCHSPAPVAGATAEVMNLYRVIKSPPLTIGEARLVRLIQRAIRKKSAWGEQFTATELAGGIKALSGAGVSVTDLICLLDRYGVLSRGTGHFPCRRKTADLRCAMPEMKLAARRAERRKLRLRLG